MIRSKKITKVKIVTTRAGIKSASEPVVYECACVCVNQGIEILYNCRECDVHAITSLIDT